MPLVTRSQILDFQTYSDQRPTIRPKILEVKRKRRVTIGKYLLFLFENHDTVWYQIQEMMRVEQIVREKDIQHEIDTYNELLGQNGSLGVCLLITIEDEIVRAEKLEKWHNLLSALYMKLPDGTKIRAEWDQRQVGDKRLSSVQYLRFDVGGTAPIGVGCDFDDQDLKNETLLSEETQMALADDLSV